MIHVAPQITTGIVMDTTMQLSIAEINRALEIKRAVEADDRVVPISDFSYVQYALTSGEESIECICERVYLMQCFREEYRIHDTVNEGVDLILAATVNHPGYLLAVEHLVSTQNYARILDLAAFYPSSVKTDENLRVVMGYNYYVWQAVFPNFQAIRNGMTTIVECMDTTFDNFDHDVLEKLMVHLYKPYPKNQLEFFFVNSPTVVNIIWGLMKRTVPFRERRKYILGHHVPGFEGRRIDALYKLPNEDVARVRLLNSVLFLLRLREKNEVSFSLDPLIPPPVQQHPVQDQNQEA